METTTSTLPLPEAPQWGVIAGWVLRTGTPDALGEEKLSWPIYDRMFVARDEAGAPASLLMVRIDPETDEPYALIAITRTDRRRQGLATALFAVAAAAGVPVEELSGANGLTADGAAFQAARRSFVAESGI